MMIKSNGNELLAANLHLNNKKPCKWISLVSSDKNHLDVEQNDFGTRGKYRSYLAAALRLIWPLYFGLRVFLLFIAKSSDFN